MKPKAVITHWVHPEVVELLATQCDVIANPTRETLPRPEVIRLARDAHALMAFMPDHVDEAFLRACPKLRVVSGALKGYDNFDVEACTRRGVWLTIVRDLLTVPTAELTVGLLIALTRNVALGDRFVRSGWFAGWRPMFYGPGLAGKTLGIIGMGAVGRALAQRLSAFDMRLLYTDPVALHPEQEQRWNAARVALPELLRGSDYVVPLLPLRPDTLHLIDAAALRQMKPGAYLINTCRGSVVNEYAVGEALAHGHLAGYAADVFEFEDWARSDRPPAIPSTLLEQADRTLFAPHLGSAVSDVRIAIELEAARSILQALAGRAPQGAINRPLERAIA